jgi:hypothetical protein
MRARHRAVRREQPAISRGGSERAEQHPEHLGRPREPARLFETRQQLFAKCADAPLERRFDQAGEASEVMRDQRVAHSRLAGDVLEADLVRLELAEHALGRIEELFAGNFRRPTATRSNRPHPPRNQPARFRHGDRILSDP